MEYVFYLTDWNLWKIIGIFSDGLAISGHGAKPAGQIEAWPRVTQIPASLLLLGSGLLGLGLLGWRRRRG